MNRDEVTREEQDEDEKTDKDRMNREEKTRDRQDEDGMVDNRRTEEGEGE